MRVHVQIGIQTRTVADLTAVADFVRTNNVPLLFVALLLLQFVSMVVDRLVSNDVNNKKAEWSNPQMFNMVAPESCNTCAFLIN